MRAYPQLSAFGKVGTWRMFRKSRNILGSSSFSKMTVCKKKKGTIEIQGFFNILDITHFYSSYQNISHWQHFSILLHFFYTYFGVLHFNRKTTVLNESHTHTFNLCYYYFSPAITGAKLDASQAEMSDSGTKLLAHSFVNKILFT